MKPSVATITGLACAIGTWLYRWKKHGKAEPKFLQMVLVFIGSGGIPLGIALIAYNLFDTPPDLKEFVLYMPVSGIGLLFAAWEAIKQGGNDIDVVPAAANPPDPRPATPPPSV